MFMIKEIEKITTGSVHEDDIFILNDVLVLMTLKTTITWMQKHNYWHWWLLLFNSLQDCTPYVRRPVGNSPKFMPSYNSPNRDNFTPCVFIASWDVFFWKVKGMMRKKKWDLMIPYPSKIASVLNHI